MKIKIIFLIIGFIFNILLNSNIVYALSNIKVSSSGQAINSGNITIQNISLNFSAVSGWKLLVSIPNSFLTNNSHPSKFISVNNLTIEDSQNNKQFILEPGRQIILDNGNISGVFNKEYRLKFLNTNAVDPGNYTGILQFSLISGMENIQYYYPVSFNQPECQKIIINPVQSNINIQPVNTLKKGFSQESSMPTMFYIQANTKWKLVCKKITSNKYLDLKFKILSLPENSHTNYNKDYYDFPDDNFVLVEGEPTLDNTGKNIETKIIEVNYLLKTKNAEILPAGNFMFEINCDVQQNL